MAKLAAAHHPAPPTSDSQSSSSYGPEIISESPQEHTSTEPLDTSSSSRPEESSQEVVDDPSHIAVQSTNHEESLSQLDESSSIPYESSTFDALPSEPLVIQHQNASDETQSASLVESSSASSLSPPQTIEVDFEPAPTMKASEDDEQDERVDNDSDNADEPDDGPSETLIFLDPQALDFHQQQSYQEQRVHYQPEDDASIAYNLMPELSPTSKDAMTAGAETTSAIEAPAIDQAPSPVNHAQTVATKDELKVSTDSNQKAQTLETSTISASTKQSNHQHSLSSSDQMLAKSNLDPGSEIASAGVSESSSITAETNSGSTVLETAAVADSTPKPAESPGSKRRAERNLSDIIGTKSPLSPDIARRKIKPSASTSSPSNRHSIAIDSPAAIRFAGVSGDYGSPPTGPNFNPNRRSTSGQPEFGDYSSITQSASGKLQSSNSQGGIPTTPSVRHSKSNFFSGLLSNGKSKKDKEKDKESKDKDKKEKEKSKKHKKSKHASVDFQTSPPKGKLVPITPYTMEQILHSTNVAKPDTVMNEAAPVRPFVTIQPFDPSILDSMPVQPLPTYSQSHRRSPSPGGALVSPAITHLQKDHDSNSAPNSVKKKKKLRGSEKVSPAATPTSELSSSGGRTRSNSEATRPPTFEKSKSKSKSSKQVFTGGGSHEDY